MERQPPLPLHLTQVPGPVEEGAMRAVMDETVEAEMEEDIESLLPNSNHQVHLIVPTPSHI